jgi:hypothetical protein
VLGSLQTIPFPEKTISVGVVLVRINSFLMLVFEKKFNFISYVIYQVKIKH